MAAAREDISVTGGVIDGGSKKYRLQTCPASDNPDVSHPETDNHHEDDGDIAIGDFLSTPPRKPKPSQVLPTSDQDDEYPSVFLPSSQSSGFTGGLPSPDYIQHTLNKASEKLAQLVKDHKLTEEKPKMSIERPKLLFVDGTFAELAQAMADIVQVGEQVKPLLEKEQNEEALQTIVKASIHLNSIPEKDFNPSYNLLIHLVLESKDPKKYLPTMCGNLLKPITSSPVNHMNLASNALTTIFNLLAPDNSLRYNVFMQICRFLKQNNHYEGLRPMLKNLPKWLKDWDTDEEDARKLYVEVAEIASEGGDGE